VERGSEHGNESPTPPATVQRLIAVLDAFLAARGELGVTELAGRLGLAKSVIHRLVSALSAAGYLAHNPSTRRYRLGPKTIRLGLVALGHLEVCERARPWLIALAAETGETATLSILDGAQRVYVDQVESSQPVRQSIQFGRQTPLYIGASGKAMLAFLPAARSSPLIREAIGLRVRQANGSALDESTLLRDLDEVRQRGFAISVSERILGAASAAAPILDHHGEVVACISVASVTVRHDRADLLRFGPRVREYAQRISTELGYMGHTTDDEQTALWSGAGLRH
jgi:DNA-binding IclR family transcriptional regulator